MNLSTENLVVEAFPVGNLASNCTLIYSPKTQEAILIDPGNDAQNIIDRIESQNLKVSKLIHTHAHFDHIGASGVLKKHFNTPIYLHTDDLHLYKHIEQQGIFGEFIPPADTVDHIFKEDDLLGFGKQQTIETDTELETLFQVLHTPGHSMGSCCLYTTYFSTPLLISGDTLFRDSIGRTDLPGGEYDSLITSVKTKLFTLPENTIVVTGHGPETTIGHEKQYNPFF